VEVCADVATGINPDADTEYTYRWSPSAGLDDATAANPSATIDMDQLYTVTATDANGCEYVDSVLVTVRPSVAVIEKTVDTLVCLGDSLTLMVSTTPGNEVTWFADSQLNTLLGEGSEYVANPVAGRNVYFVAVRDTICGTSTVDSIIVDVPDFEPVSPADTLMVCIGDSISLNPGGDSDFTYNWMPGEVFENPSVPNPTLRAENAGLFTVEITDPTGQCTVLDTTEVFTNASPDFTLDGDTILCEEAPYVIGVETEENLTWEWAEDADFMDVLSTDSTLAIDPIIGQRTFYVRGTDPVTGCQQVDSILVNYQPVQANLEVLDIACEDGDIVRVQVNNEVESQELMYLWSPENLLVGGDPMAGPTVEYIVEGTVNAEVVLSNQFNCTAILEEVLQPVNINDQISLVANDTIVTSTDQVTLMVEGCSDCTYEWFQDSVLISGENGSMLEIMLDETAEISVVATTADGCVSDTLRQIIKICECEPPFVFVPTGFTPNGDGMNDFLRVYGDVILEEDFEFMVRNRWDEEVYFTTDVNDQGWDGTYQGQDLPPDVYGYYVQYRCSVDGELYFLKGNVTLIR